MGIEIDVRTGQVQTVDAIRFHDAAVLKQTNATTLAVTNNTGTVLVSVPKVAVDAFIAALQQSKIVFP